MIYLDRFAFSELHKLRAGQRRADKWTKFWEGVDQRLNGALLLQQIVLPHSDVHHDETIVSPFAKQLRETQEQIGGDIRLVDTVEVQLRQVQEFARAFFAGEAPSPSFDVDQVLDGNRNAWLPRIRITVNRDWSSFAAATRQGRADTHASVSSLIDGWRRLGWGFDEVLERELGAYSESRHDAVRHAFERLQREQARGELFAELTFGHAFAIREMQLVFQLAAKVGVPEEGYAEAANSFWRWDGNREQPYGRMLAYMFAALAAQVKAGRMKLPTAGLMNDIKAISAYAPYVDAMFVDKECATLLNHGRCRKELSYKAQIFSYANADEFIAYIDALTDKAPADVSEQAKALYRLI